jgi:hypothetical protein
MMLFLLTPASLAVAGHARKKTSPKCPSAGSRIVAADGQAAVYTAPENPREPEFLGVYGCSYTTKRSFLLGPSLPTGAATPGGVRGVSNETIAGPMLAYIRSSGGPAGQESELRVRDSRNGKVVRAFPTQGSEGVGDVSAIVLENDGAVAWMTTRLARGPHTVYAFDTNGIRVLAEGTNIGPSSLALAGSTLYWTQEAKPMSATLN